MKRLPFLVLLLAAGVSAGLAGCGESSSGEFHEFPAQQEVSRAADDPGADGANNQANPADQTLPDSGITATESTLTGASDSAANDDPVEAPAPAVPASSPQGDQIAAVSGTAPDLSRPLDPALGLRPMPQISSDPPVVDDGQPTEPREIKLLVPNKTFKVEGPEGALRVSYDDLDLLKVLNMEPVPVDCVDYFPDWLKELDGKRIRIRGFMFPPFQETDIPFFVLARDNQICCFGRNPKRYDVIDVVMREGVTTNYIQNRPFDVVGVLHIRPEASGGKLYQLYVIDDAIVIDK